MTRSHLLAAALGVLLGVLLSLFVVAGAASRSVSDAVPGQSGAPSLPPEPNIGVVEPVSEVGSDAPYPAGSRLPVGGAPTPTAQRSPNPRPTLPKLGVASWHHDPEISFFGPGLYGRQTACGLALTTHLLGVAHRSLPCGTLVTFRWRGRTLIVPVVDRGPFVAGRTWDLTGGACVVLRHCWTGPIEWRMP